MSKEKQKKLIVEIMQEDEKSGIYSSKVEKINIQDEVIKIHHQYGTSEKANYKIQLLAEAYADQEVKPVQQELERWKYLYQTEFNKPKTNPN